MFPLSRRRIVAAVIATVVANTSVLAASSHAASTGTHATASPGSGLLDGQFVHVTWSGFPASTDTALQGVAVAQCSSTAKIPMKDCAGSVGGVSDTTGSGVATLQLHVGDVTSYDGSKHFTCDDTNACEIAVFVDNSLPLTASKQPFAITPITFGFPADNCPHNGSGISGSGGEAGYRAILAWEAHVCVPPTSLDVSYVRTESRDGKNAYIGDQAGATPTDYAVTSVPFDAAEQARLAKVRRTYRYSPIAASGLVFVFHGVDRVTGQPLTHMTLTPGELAHIFNGSRNSLPTAASDAESTDIINLNPGVNFTPNLTAFGRLDHAAGTLEMTSWFLATASHEWKDELPPWVAGRVSSSGSGSETVDYQHPTDALPDGLQGPGANGQLINGSDNLGLLLAGKGSIGDNPSLTAMGYLDASTAAFYGLPTVCLQLDPHWQTTHTPCVDATPANISKALAGMTSNADGTITVDPAKANGGYPVLDVSYAVTPTGLTDAAKVAKLRSFLTYAITTGQHGDVLPPSYAPLPDKLVNAAKASIALLDKNPPPPTTTTTSTVPTTSTTSFFQGGGGSGHTGGGGFLGGGGSTSTTYDNSGTPTTSGAKTTRTTTKTEHLTAEQVAHYSPAGHFLSGGPSWFVIFALTVFAFFGLLTSPLRRFATTAFVTLRSTRAASLRLRRSKP